MGCNVLTSVGFAKNFSKVGISLLLAHACGRLAYLAFKYLRNASHILISRRPGCTMVAVMGLRLGLLGIFKARLFLSLLKRFLFLAGTTHKEGRGRKHEHQEH